MTVPSVKLVTQTALLPTAIPSGRPPTSIGSPLTCAVSRSMRETVPSPAFVTQRSPSPTASASGARPTGIEVARPSTIRSTASSPDAATQTAPRATTGLSGWRPAGMAAPARRSEPASMRMSVPPASVTHTSEPATVMPSGPRPTGIVAATEGCRPEGAAAAALRLGPGHELGDGRDLGRRQAPLERGHAPGSGGHDRLGRVRARLRVVEVGAADPGRARRAERVTPAAAGGDEDLLARRRRRRAGRRTRRRRRPPSRRR